MGFWEDLLRVDKRWPDDERMMATFFPKLIALAVSILVFVALLVWLTVHIMC
ncbi:MAG TPA: hypothetical protein VD862_04830 [Candidatus Paceibacterota bacterium]|nr:hypothetical protein [Candidatus Paceibacterota bacterium]